MILGICDLPDVLKVMQIVKYVITILKISVPVLLLVTGALTYMNAMKSGDADIAGANKIFIKKVIASILIFLVPTFVGIVVKISGENGYKNCLDMATSEGIVVAYNKYAQKMVDAALNSLNESDYNLALNYINSNITDESSKNQLLGQMSNIKGAVETNLLIAGLDSKNYRERIKEIEEAIANTTDPEIKAKLEEKLQEKKETIRGYVGDYPIVPFDEDDQYKGLKVLHDESLADMLKRNGSSIEELNDKIATAVELAGPHTREGTVAAAITLIGVVSDYGYKIPYRWGGKRYDVGADGNWGKVLPHNGSCSSYVERGYAETDAECQARHKWSGLDCSGFVNWSIVQSLQKHTPQGETNGGKSISLGSNTKDHAVCEIGDALTCPGHIVLVVGLDDENNRYIIAEESSNMEIRSVNYDGSRGGTHYTCVKLDHNYE